jgi:hypothetical protein
MKTFRVLLIITLVSSTIASVMVFKVKSEEAKMQRNTKNKTTQTMKGEKAIERK